MLAKKSKIHLEHTLLLKYRDASQSAMDIIDRLYPIYRLHYNQNKSIVEFGFVTFHLE